MHGLGLAALVIPYMCSSNCPLIASSCSCCASRSDSALTCGALLAPSSASMPSAPEAPLINWPASFLLQLLSQPERLGDYLWAFLAPLATAAPAMLPEARQKLAGAVAAILQLVRGGLTAVADLSALEGSAPNPEFRVSRVRPAWCGVVCLGATGRCKRWLVYGWLVGTPLRVPRLEPQPAPMLMPLVNSPLGSTLQMLAYTRAILAAISGPVAAEQEVGAGLRCMARPAVQRSVHGKTGRAVLALLWS